MLNLVDIGELTMSELIARMTQIKSIPGNSLSELIIVVQKETVSGVG